MKAPNESSAAAEVETLASLRHMCLPYYSRKGFLSRVRRFRMYADANFIFCNDSDCLALQFMRFATAIQTCRIYQRTDGIDGSPFRGSALRFRGDDHFSQGN